MNRKCLRIKRSKVITTHRVKLTLVVDTWKGKRLFGALVGIEAKLGHVLNGSYAKHRFFTDVRVMNAIVHNQN